MWKQVKKRYVCVISICVCTQPRHHPVIRWAICRVVFHIMMSWHPWYVFTMLLFYSNVTEGFTIWFVLLQFCWFALLMSNCTSFENIFRSSIFFYLLSFLQLSLLLYADTLLFITILLLMFILVFWSHLDSFTLSENSSPAFVLLSRHKQLWCFLSKQHREKRKRGKNRLDLMKHLMKSKSWIQLRFLCCFVFCQIEVFSNVYWKRNDVSQSHSGAQVTDKPWLNQMTALLRWQDSSV